MITWSRIKQYAQIIYPAYIGAGKLIDDSNGTNSEPCDLALVVDLVNNRIASYPLEFDFLKKNGTLTLTGATSYNLKTYFPDLKSVFQIYGINQNQQHPFYPNKEANITPNEGYTLKGNTLTFTGNAPTSGTLNVQYKSSYLVETSGGTRQKYFLDDTDVTVLDEDNINVIIYGLADYINWRSDSEDGNRKNEIKTWFEEEFNKLKLHNKQTNQLDSML